MTLEQAVAYGLAYRGLLLALSTGRCQVKRCESGQGCQKASGLSLGGLSWAHSAQCDVQPFGVTLAADLSIPGSSEEVSTRTEVAMGVSAAVILGSGFLASEPRLLIWAAFAVAWFGALLIVRRDHTVLSLGTTATDSLVERFGTFTIIVLGEVVLGVVAGLVSAERDGMTIAVGLLALCIGFGLWWIYFDVVGRRLPRNGPALTN